MRGSGRCSTDGRDRWHPSLVLRIALDEDGRPGETELRREPATQEPRTAKVHGRYLTPYLAGRPALDEAPAVR
jgi:hypothetical protein